MKDHRATYVIKESFNLNFFSPEIKEKLTKNILRKAY